MRAALQRPDAEAFFRGLAEQTPFGRLSEDDARIIRAGSASTPLHVHAGGLEGGLDPASWSLDPIPVPLLVLLAGGHDASFRSDAEQQFVRTLAPHAQIVVWEDASHFLIMEHAARFNRLLEEFLEGIGR
jgi:pimeloyl-ACP methyl ester carboxylesterase